MTRSERMTRFADADLYVVITEEFCGGRSSSDVLEAVLEAGVSLVQLREKHLDDCALYARALDFRERTRQAGALLIVDDRVDVALAAGADGVHLGQSDLPVQAARAIAPDLLVGASTHSLEEALDAQKTGASYVNIGPIFATQTKDVPTGVVGPELIAEAVPHLHIPFTVMGGINADNISQVLAHGARCCAVVTAVTAADNPKAAAAALREVIRAGRA
jgi:thiamine-phosphate pyrophosphorylase